MPTREGPRPARNAQTDQRDAGHLCHRYGNAAKFLAKQ